METSNGDSIDPFADTVPWSAGRLDGESGPARASVSVVICTKDEELNIAGCLQCFEFTDDVVVLDSHSSDRTVEIAESFPNVRVVRRPFDTEWKHRNFGLHGVEFKHDWVYICDADERIDKNLVDEILAVASDAGAPHAAYRLRYRNIYLGHWIKHASTYPVWIIRLVRPKLVSYEVRETNVHPVVRGTVGELHNHFVHYSFNSGLERWFHKHNFYSTREAMEGAKVRMAGLPSWRSLREGDPMARRRAAKNMSYFLPARALWRFVYAYVFRGGFLDGRAGFHYCAMTSMYEYWIELKVREIEHVWTARTEQAVNRLLAEGPAAGREERAAPAGGPRVEILIPTLNEAEHITETVRNALALGPVFVLDSFSTDDTPELARAAGATVFQRKFTNYSDQKNWALDNLPFQGEWLFILDADERITPPLRDEIRRALARAGPADGYFVNRVVIFMGREIRHGGLYPSWNLRLFRRGKARYEDRAVHEHMICSGPTAYLKHEMLHIRRESINTYLAKHIRYADMESDEWVKWRLGRSGGGAEAKELFRDVLRYRQWVRRKIWPRLPMRPGWRFVYMYVVKLGVLDGRAGWHLARLMACYEYMISLLYRDKLIRAAEAEGDNRRPGIVRREAHRVTE